MLELDTQEISKFDSLGMLERILKFPDQLRHAQEIARETRLNLDVRQISNVCISGMGGSAISGDIVRSYTTESSKIPIFVNRYYTLPGFVDDNSLVIASSYSGNTEETLAAYEDALQRKARMACITSGGVLADKAKANGHPVFSIPTGYQPRAALGYMTVPLLYCLHKTGLMANPDAEILETIDRLGKLREEYHPDNGNNLAKEISRQLVGKIPVIYAAYSGFEAVAWRWKGQLSENGKVLAFANVFPELNHNEIMGWGPLSEVNRKVQVIFLTDREDHPQVQKRMAITKAIVEEHTTPVIEVESSGDSLLTRIFSLIFLGDMLSLYLAILNKADPSPVDNIDYLKIRLLE